jgi:AraC family transcriptional regulator of adaptative response / DNA-3-methyladenine glycosylase II
MLSYLEARAIPGVEVVENARYSRTVEIAGATGSFEVTHLPRLHSLSVSIRFPEVRALPAIVARVRRVFDLGADIGIISGHLQRDPLLAPLVSLRPGLRAPGGWDGFELAIRAILGQHISVAAARRLAGELVALHGKPLDPAHVSHPGLTYVFPTAADLAASDSVGLRIPATRARSLRALAEAAAADKNLFRPLGTVEEAISRLRTIHGVGEWTAQYIALRALRETDAFPAADLGLLRSIARIHGERATANSLLERAESWRPWRAYAAQHLWTAEASAARPA